MITIIMIITIVVIIIIMTIIWIVIIVIMIIVIVIVLNMTPTIIMIPERKKGIDTECKAKVEEVDGKDASRMEEEIRNETDQNIDTPDNQNGDIDFLKHGCMVTR